MELNDLTITVTRDATLKRIVLRAALPGVAVSTATTIADLRRLAAELVTEANLLEQEEN